jgi:hypothetical protein
MGPAKISHQHSRPLVGPFFGHSGPEEVQQDPLQLTEEEAGIARSGMPARHEEAGPPYDVEISTSRIEEVPRE